jgi:serpin B
MCLVNALAFDARWEKPYEEYQVSEGIFTTEDGREQTVELMYAEDTYTYVEDDLCTGFLKDYEGGRYAFVALLPKEGITVGEYVEGLTGEHLNHMLSEPEDIMVLTTIPKFETEYSTQMSGVLREMGMTDAFSQNDADFSKLGIYHADGANIFINEVLHKTFISVAEQGTKAGAATAVIMYAAGAPAEKPEYRTVNLDRPFVYMLIDCETNLPFFIGTMMDID